MSSQRLTPESEEAIRAYLEAEDVAARHSQGVHSAHLLLALLHFPNRAHVLLRERHIDAAWVRQAWESGPGKSSVDARRSLARLRERARAIAQQASAEEVDCLHLLVAMTRMRDTCAYKILQHGELLSGHSLAALRNVAVSYITGTLPRRFRDLPQVRKPLKALLPYKVSALSKLPQALCDGSQAAQAEKPPEALQGAVQGTLQETRPKAPPLLPSSTPTLRSLPSAKLESRPVLSKLATTTQRGSTTSPHSGTSTSPSLQEIAPTLYACGTDLIERARRGLLDVAIGREREMGALIDILGKRRANNPMLIGPPGVGKTAIVEGLAVKIARREAEVHALADCYLVALDTGSLLAGTSLRGAFSERLALLKAEVAASGRRIIVFIDEMHTLVGAGQSGEGAQDAASELKTALARGEFPCIGATTPEEFKRYIEKDAALERRFTPILVEEPSCAAAVQIIEGAILPYAQHHALSYSLEAIHAAVHLSYRFVNERKLPDKAFAAVDLAGSRARRRGAQRVEQRDIALVVSEWSGVPMTRLIEADAQRLSDVENILNAQVVGQTAAVKQLANALRRGFAGLNGNLPMGSFLFLGPSGVGKTELAKALASFLFGKNDALVRFDMSELSERHSVARLVGAQPGYVGFEEGGQLTEALRKRPFQVVLFDEIDKAHPEVLNLLLQILDEGVLTDSRGRRTPFQHTLVILTSNLGSHLAPQAPLGFQEVPSTAATATPQLAKKILAAAQARLAPALWDRLDERLVFLPLNTTALCEVAALQLHKCAQRLQQEQQLQLVWDSDILNWLAHCKPAGESLQGGRLLRQAIRQHIEGPLAEMLLQQKLRAGQSVQVSLQAATPPRSGSLRLTRLPAANASKRAKGAAKAATPEHSARLSPGGS